VQLRREYLLEELVLVLLIAMNVTPVQQTSASPAPIQMLREFGKENVRYAQ
jgi:hypothetical protein